MASKRFIELKNLSQDELNARIRELEAKLFDAKMKKATAQLGDTALIWKARKDIAMIKTIQGQMAAAQGSK